MQREACVLEREEGREEKRKRQKLLNFFTTRTPQKKATIWYFPNNST